MAQTLGNHITLTEKHSTSNNYQEKTSYIIYFYITTNTIYNSEVKKRGFSQSKHQNISEFSCIFIRLMLEMSIPIYSKANTTVNSLDLEKVSNFTNKDQSQSSTINNYNLEDTLKSSSSATRADTTSKNNESTEILRPSQPIAEPNHELINQIRNCQEKVQLKFIELSSNINNLHDRLRKLQMRHISSHVACEVKNAKMQGSEKKTAEETIDVVCNNFEPTKTEKLERLFDLACYLDGETTDEETILESNINFSEKKGKRKLIR